MPADSTTSPARDRRGRRDVVEGQSAAPVAAHDAELAGSNDPRARRRRRVEKELGARHAAADRHDAADQSLRHGQGRARTTPSEEPTPISALWTPARRSRSSTGALPTTTGSAAPTRAGRLAPRTGAPRRAGGRAPAPVPRARRRSRSLSARAVKQSASDDDVPDTARDRAEAAGERRRGRQDPGLEHGTAPTPGGRLGRQDQHADDEHRREDGAAPAGIDAPRSRRGGWRGAAWHEGVPSGLPFTSVR